VQKHVHSTDELDLNSSFQITGNQNQSNGQRYYAADSTGYCYEPTIGAIANVLTAILNGTGCK